MSNNKAVLFVDDESLCAYHNGAVMDAEGVSANDIWYQCNEMQLIKRKALLQTTKDPSRHEVSAVLNNTYGRDDPATIDSVTAWCRGCSSRRGLERFLNKDYYSRRSELRKRVMTSVLRAQQKMRDEGIDDPDYVSKVLSRLSETFSKDSSAFARALGIGDEAATAEHQTPMDVDDDPRKKLSRNDSPASVMDLFATTTSAQQPPANIPMRPQLQTYTSRRTFSPASSARDLGWRSFA